MAKKHYKVTSEQGAARYQAELDTELELDLEEREERAVVAAGWLEPLKKKGKEA